MFPVTVDVPTGVPFLRSVRMTEPEGVPEPDTVTVRFVRVTDEGLGLFRVTCRILIWEAPGNWVELGEEPLLT